MIAEGTDAAAVTPEQIRQVADDVEAFCRAYKVQRVVIAKAIGYTGGVISEFLNGKYAGNEGKIAIALDEWLVEEEQRRSKQQRTVFVETAVVKQIFSVATYCLDFRKVGLIYGPETSGLGKTMAMQAIYQKMGPRRATMITIDKCDANPTGLLKKIIAGMRLENTGSNAQKMRRIVEHLNGRSHLLMIDQVHNLRFAKEDRPFYYLMDIYDASQTAQLWAGTSDMVAYLQRQQAKTIDEPLAQIRRRIFPVIDLMASTAAGGDGGEPLYTIDDILEMFSTFKLKLTHSAAKWLRAFACVPGSGALGACVNFVEFATMLGESRRVKEITIALLKEAVVCGLTSERSSWVLRETEQMMGSAVARAG